MVDVEAVSNAERTVERIRKSLINCETKNQLLDTFAIDHLFSKLNSESVAILSCLSPIINTGLPYFVNYLKPSKIENKDFLCIPLCDGLHFNGYIVDIKEKQSC